MSNYPIDLRSMIKMSFNGFRLFAILDEYLENFDIVVIEQFYYAGGDWEVRQNGEMIGDKRFSDVGDAYKFALNLARENIKNG